MTKPKHKEKKHELALTTREPDDALVPYLADDAVETTPVILALVPPDLTRCQCEWQDQSQQTFGPKPLVRCEHPPTVVAFQKRVRGEHDPTGAMSLCDDHRVMVEHMFPEQCYFRKITLEKKIGAVAP